MRELYRRYRGPRPGNRIRFLNRGRVQLPAEKTADDCEAVTDQACGTAQLEGHENKAEAPAPKAD
jgi:hypothetical protein